MALFINEVMVTEDKSNALSHCLTCASYYILILTASATDNPSTEDAINTFGLLLIDYFLNLYNGGDTFSVPRTC